ncbi:MAG: GH32 C-terminal domain-containing protein [Planctomycetota bacterium]
MPTTRRPGFHFTSRAGWINDPNGLIHFAGETHLFYQWSPRFGVNDPLSMHWCHAITHDFVTWEPLPMALPPDELGSPWSGSCVADVSNSSGLFETAVGGLVAVYTAHHPNGAERQCLAVSADRGRTWAHHQGNPVLGDDTTRDFRDPKVFWHAPTGHWTMIVGVPHRLYTSPDLKKWTLSQELPFKSECPDLLPVPIEGETGERWLLNLGGREYVIGQFDGEHFTPDGPARPVDGGPDFYAPQAWNDLPPLTEAERAHSPAGCADHARRAVWIGWMNNWQYAKAVPHFGAWGVFSIPRELTLRRHADGALRLIQRPVRELGQKAQPQAVTGGDASEDDVLARGRRFVLDLRLRVAPGDCCGVQVFMATDEVELPPEDPTAAGADSHGLWVGFDDARKCWFLVRQPEEQSLPPGRFEWPVEDAGSGGERRLRLVLDECVLEAFADDGAVVFSSQVFAPFGNDLSMWFSGNDKSQASGERRDLA